MKNKKKIKISNTKRRMSVLTKDSRDSFLGFCELNTEEKFIVYVVACLYLSNDSISGFEITSKALNVKDKGKSCLYIANMMRMHALFLEKIC